MGGTRLSTVPLENDAQRGRLRSAQMPDTAGRAGPVRSVGAAGAIIAPAPPAEHQLPSAGLPI